MVGFETIAKPHSDILRGDFTLDTYAAKLGSVVRKEGPLEYRNSQQFFKKTFITEGLKVLMTGVEGRLTGKDRKNQDPIIQLQTPFGGGKTHTLIALYHKAREWNAKPVVIVGHEIDVKQTFWGEIEFQLTGKIERFKDNVAPGSNSLLQLFNETGKPVLILMDEVLQYLKRSSGVSVHDGSLAEQTLAFILSLTEAVSSSKHVTFIVTLQESEVASLADLFPLFKALLQRMQRMVTPVNDSEIASIIRSRIFSQDDFKHKEAKNIVRQFTSYARKESILPVGVQESEYRDRFTRSYPFQPEVIDVLYERWGTLPSFQRTRGVLRLLSRVVHLACGKNRPYITLADFDLQQSDIRSELLGYIEDPAFNGVIASDITGHNAGAKVVDSTLGDTYKNFALGTRTASTIFLYSFSGSTDGQARGATQGEIKRSTAHISNLSSIIDTTTNRLNQSLSYLRVENGKAYFDKQPNLSRIVKIREENIDTNTVKLRTYAHIKKSLKPDSSSLLKMYIVPKNSKDIPDTPEMKLIVLSNRDDTFSQELLKTYNNKTRVYHNTLFFLTPSSGKAVQLQDAIRKIIAYEEICKDNSLNLSTTQKGEVNAKLRNVNKTLDDALQHDYRTVLIPEKEGFSEADLGMPALGVTISLEETVYEMLRVKGKILTNIGPRNISLRYLKDNDAVFTSSQLYLSSLRTPGENLILRDAWITGISRGVEEGLFGLGEKVDGKLIPIYFKINNIEVTLDNDEVIIQPNLIRENIIPKDILHDYLRDNDAISTNVPFQYDPQSTNEPRPLLDMWKSAIREGVKKGIFGLGNKVNDKITLSAFRQEPSTITLGDSEVLIRATICTELIVEPPRPEPPDNDESTDNGEDGNPLPDEPSKKTIGIRFKLPQGKVSNVAQHLNQLQSIFQNMQLELKASEGEISQDAYEKLKVDLRELGIEIEEV